LIGNACHICGVDSVVPPLAVSACVAVMGTAVGDCPELLGRLIATPASSQTHVA
jgi:hypothetical protein